MAYAGHQLIDRKQLLAHLCSPLEHILIKMYLVLLHQLLSLVVYLGLFCDRKNLCFTHRSINIIVSLTRKCWSWQFVTLTAWWVAYRVWIELVKPFSALCLSHIPSFVLLLNVMHTDDEIVFTLLVVINFNLQGLSDNSSPIVAIIWVIVSKTSLVPIWLVLSQKLRLIPFMLLGLLRVLYKNMAAAFLLGVNILQDLVMTVFFPWIKLLLIWCNSKLGDFLVRVILSLYILIVILFVPKGILFHFIWLCVAMI